MRTKCLHVLALLVLLSATNASFGIPNFFMPFGLTHGDTEAPQNDDGSTGELVLNCSFNMFGSVFNSIWVNTNGVLSFEDEIDTYTPRLLPAESAMVAPWWADVDTRDGHGPGRIFYRETTDAADLNLIEDDVTAALGSTLGSFCPTWAFVATWYDVTFYNGDASTPRNTFQAVLAQDAGGRSVAFFNYGEMLWTTGGASGGYYSYYYYHYYSNYYSNYYNFDGLGGTEAVAGYFANDGPQNHLNLPGSLTPAVLDLQDTSNVGMPGQWFFAFCDDCTPPTLPVECFTCDWTSGSPNDPIDVVEQLCNDQANKTTCAEGEVCWTRLKCNDEHIPRPGQSTSGAQIIYRLKKECASPDKCHEESWFDGYLYKNEEKNLVVSKCCSTCGCCNEQHGEEIDFEFGDTHPLAPVEHFGQGFGNGRYFCSIE